MGWTCTNKPKGMSIREFFEREFNYTRDDGRYGKILDCAVVNLRTAYIAYEIGDVQGKREVTAIVCALSFSPNSYYNFCYKDMSESMGPYYYDCPERILKMLTPTDHEWAREWREKCWERIRAKKTRPKLKRGMIIKFADSIVFKSRRQEDTFRVEDPRRLIFSDRWGKRYKLRRDTLDWEFQVLEDFPPEREIAVSV
ncbi:hypothetical protein Desku_0934 [Desulfofundulus kuznetsovii DSM 6115]|uniref:DUF6927 domain-containing protein n=1 Tax=Desulfofundulus kuznetsovii (strain DSM 6115 / VKM B-1805 / 17) TaxID=760568 RepID=A0AAU8Q1G2_DESK7|nr:hypothetical protein Desku_0934 [Desulfofundulus kuznetsovii DSM 6115]